MHVPLKENWPCVLWLYEKQLRLANIFLEVHLIQEVPLLGKLDIVS